ncbi:MAG TPA: hypothetical protein V6D17_01500 [Candidatus Obscuribacterales bacterium]
MLTTHAKIQTPTVPATAKPRRGHLVISYALAGLVLLAVINLAAAAFYKPDPFATPNRSWAYWAAKDCKAHQGAPDIIFFGSSLMLAVINDSDATFLQRTLDAVSHHHSAYFEKVMSEKLKRPIRTASFAIGGQMASDAYALSKFLLRKDQQPLIVWGIAPRDLVDSSFQDPCDSETIHYLQKVAAPDDVLPEKKRFWANVENQLNKWIYIYQKRFDLQALQHSLCRWAINQLMGTKFDTIQTPQAILKMAKGNLPEDTAPGQWMVAPYNRKHALGMAAFADNSKEYQMRYRPFKEQLFERQCTYVERFLDLAKQKGSRVVFVNMPLLPENLAILPDGIYALYLRRLHAIASKHGALVIDFNKDGLFDRSDFCDPVHLHGEGGQKFLRMLANRLNVRAQLAAKAAKRDI